MAETAAGKALPTSDRTSRYIVRPQSTKDASTNTLQTMPGGAPSQMKGAAAAPVSGMPSL